MIKKKELIQEKNERNLTIITEYRATSFVLLLLLLCSQLHNIVSVSLSARLFSAQYFHT